MKEDNSPSEVSRPQQFLEEVVQPNLVEFEAAVSNVRLAFNAVASVDALAAHIYVWCRENSENSNDAKKEIACVKTDDSYYRAKLASECPEFELLRDIAKAQKHVRRKWGNPQITGDDKVMSSQIGYGEGGYGCGRYGGPMQVVVLVGSKPEDFVFLEDVLKAATDFLKGKMKGLGALIL